MSPEEMRAEIKRRLARYTEEQVAEILQLVELTIRYIRLTKNFEKPLAK